MLPPKGTALARKGHQEHQAGRCVQGALVSREWLEWATTWSWVPVRCGVFMAKRLRHVTVVSQLFCKILVGIDVFRSSSMWVNKQEMFYGSSLMLILVIDLSRFGIN